MQDTEQFKVINETKDFALIALNLSAQFRGRPIRAILISEIVEHYQYLLDEHGLMPIHVRERFKSPTTGELTTLLTCRKVRIGEGE